jgi:hypothetical protein
MLLNGGLIFGLTLAAAGANAADGISCAVAGRTPVVIASTEPTPPPAPAITLERPVCLGAPRPTSPAPPAAPRTGLALDRPLPLSATVAVSDPGVTPAAFQWSPVSPTAMFRGQSPEAQPMPVGTPSRRPVATTTTFAIDGAEEPARDPEFLAPPPKPMPPATRPTEQPPLRPIPQGSPLLGDDCVDECAPVCDPCCPCPVDLCCDGSCALNHHLYGSAEYLLWWLRAGRVPPLVTTSPPTSLGVLGMPGTEVLFGADPAGKLRSGLRLTAGWWIDEPQTWAVEGNVFFVGRRSTNFVAGSAGVPLLARPFFNVLANAEDAELVANPLVPSLPGLLPLMGSVAVGTSTRFWGAEADLVRNVFRGPWAQVDVVAGFRYVDLEDHIDIAENLTVPFTSPAAVGTGFVVTDSFHTRNQFYGGLIGARTEFHWGDLFLNLRGSVAFGSTHEVVEIGGGTVVTMPGVGTSAFPGGLLAQPSNIGRFVDNTFSVVPEGGINLGYQLTDWARVYVGYSVLYWSHVARAGDQIDLGVNVSQIAPPRMLVGSPRPVFVFKDSDFWAQGLNFGVELRY